MCLQRMEAVGLRVRKLFGRRADRRKRPSVRPTPALPDPREIASKKAPLALQQTFLSTEKYHCFAGYLFISEYVTSGRPIS